MYNIFFHGFCLVPVFFYFSDTIAPWKPRWEVFFLTRTRIICL